MKGFSRTCLGLGFMMIGGFSWAAQPAEAQNAGPGLTVHVYNYAGVDTKSLANAEKTTTEIFRRLGVECRWADVDLDRKKNHENQAGQESYDPADISQIELALPPGTAAQSQTWAEDAMGLAAGRGPDRTQIYVFYSKLQPFVRALINGQVDTINSDAYPSGPVIMGHVIAHELGHILLNLESHSPTGVMRADWNHKDLNDAARGLLNFTPQQAQAIRAEVARRASLQAGTQSATLQLNNPGL